MNKLQLSNFVYWLSEGLDCRGMSNSGLSQDDRLLRGAVLFEQFSRKYPNGVLIGWSKDAPKLPDLSKTYVHLVIDEENETSYVDKAVQFKTYAAYADFKSGVLALDKHHDKRHIFQELHLPDIEVL